MSSGIPGCNCPISSCNANGEGTTSGACKILSVLPPSITPSSGPTCDAFETWRFRKQYAEPASILDKPDVYGDVKGKYYQAAPIGIQWGKGTCAQAIEEQNTCPTSTLDHGSFYSENVQEGQCRMMLIHAPIHTVNLHFRVTATCESWYSPEKVSTGSEDQLVVYVQQHKGEENLAENLCVKENVVGFETRLTSEDWVYPSLNNEERYMCYDGGYHKHLQSNWFIMLTSFGNEPCKGPGEDTVAPTKSPTLTPTSSPTKAPTPAPVPDVVVTDAPIVASTSAPVPVPVPATFAPVPLPTTSAPVPVPTSPTDSNTFESDSLSGNLNGANVALASTSSTGLAIGLSCAILALVAVVALLLWKKKKTGADTAATATLAACDDLNENDVCMDMQEDGIEMEVAPLQGEVEI